MRRIELDRSGRKLTGNKVWGHIIKEEWEKTTFSEFSWVYYYPCVNLVATINSIMEGMYFTRECMAKKTIQWLKPNKELHHRIPRVIAQTT